jgi:uncharacterized membrane protein YgdD (TMEM256/DUF423 family)
MFAFLHLANRVLLLLAGLLGASGVAAAAAAAHGSFGAGLNTAALFALLHGVLVVALTRGSPTRLTTIAAAIILTGAFFFCGDLAARAFLQRGLFPMAAPTGGFLLIGGWLATGLSGAFRANKAAPPL